MADLREQIIELVDVCCMDALCDLADALGVELKLEAPPTDWQAFAQSWLDGTLRPPEL